MKSEGIEGEQLSKIHILSYACLSIRALGGTLELVTNCAISEEWGTSNKDKRNFLCLKWNIPLHTYVYFSIDAN